MLYCICFSFCCFHCLQYAIVIEARANNGFNKMEVVKAVADLVPAPHSVDLSEPDLTILIQIVKACNA